jgi:signal transduction histidine kinase
MGSPTLHVLVVERAPEARLRARQLLEQGAPGAYALGEADSAAAALAAVRAGPPDCVLLGEGLADMELAAALEAIRAASDVATVVLAAGGAAPEAVEALQRGAQDYLARHTLTPAGLAAAVARAMAAVRRARARDERLAREAAAAADRTARLQALTAGLSGALTSEAVTRVITDHGLAATNANVVVVGLLDGSGERLEVAGWSGGPAPAAERRSLALGERAPPCAAVQRCAPVWLRDRAAAEAGFPGFGAVLARFGDQALATLPLLTPDGVLGAISFSFPAPSAFAPEERAFLQAIAQQCALALERARLYAEVVASQRRLQQLSQRLIEAQEQERRHLARELHDEVGQALTGVRLALELAERQPAEERAGRLAEAHGAIQELIGKIRTLSLDLRPAMLDDKGLLPAVLWLLKRYYDQTGIGVDLRHQGLGPRLPPAVETVAYRVIQEALTNVARHAGVDAATVSLLATPAHLLVQIRDGGRGFALRAALEGGRSSGLAGMHERVALLGGTLSVESGLGEGTVLTVELPLSQEPEP